VTIFENMDPGVRNQAVGVADPPRTHSSWVRRGRLGFRNNLRLPVGYSVPFPTDPPIKSTVSVKNYEDCAEHFGCGAWAVAPRLGFGRSASKTPKRLRRSPRFDS
jgi:hypothetical protein